MLWSVIAVRLRIGVYGLICDSTRDSWLHNGLHSSIVKQLHFRPSSSVRSMEVIVYFPRA
jgi:hypothetical protein